MAFVSAMSSPDKSLVTNTKVGVNGAEVYTEDGVGDFRVSLFTMLNRGLAESYIVEYVDKIVKNGNNSQIRDLFVMAFQTRDVRGGKGEKDLFYHFIGALHKHRPEIIKKMMKLVPEYGCWRDMWVLLRNIPALEESILNYTSDIFSADKAKSEGGHHKEMSLLAKWLPREGSGTYPGVARKIANHIYSDMQSARQRIVSYRKQVSSLNKVLKTVEINMCGADWKNIVPEAVPGRNLKIHKKAFLNEVVSKKNNMDYGSIQNELRYPNLEDRMKCRENFQEFAKKLQKGEVKAHGAHVVMPHELVEQLLQKRLTDEEVAINQGQWNDIRRSTLENGGLGKCVAMCDFSGSMNGKPKLISLALGILISEINHPAFRDHILSFDAQPQWHSFAGKNTLKEKIDSISRSLGQGLNTNFFCACRKILEKMRENCVPIGEEPEDLIVLTDMGWDAAHTNERFYSNEKSPEWKRQLKRIQDDFKSANEQVWGKGNPGWKIPRIVIWNLRAEYKDFHAKAEDEGVVVLSGWSPSILKALQKKGVQAITPYEGMREILDDERYDAVRKVFDECLMHEVSSTLIDSSAKNISDNT